MRLPDFFLIGAAKAGTTTLHTVLEQHPSLFMSEPKELEFFARDDRYETGIETYAKFFEGAQRDQLAGESSTIYTLSPLFPKTAERIHRHTPDAKFIYIIRNPVERSYSYYVEIVKNFQNRHGTHKASRCFEDFILPEYRKTAAPREEVFSPTTWHLPDVPELLLAGSDYAHQIEAYLKFFAPNQLLVLKLDDLINERETILHQTTDFLGIAPFADSVIQDAGLNQNFSKSHFARVAETHTVSKMAAYAGGMWRLRKILPQSARDRLRGWVLGKFGPKTQDYLPPPMKAETRAMLVERFAAQYDRLSELTGLTFEDWK